MITKKSLLVTSLLALAVSFSAIASKPIYKWKDNQGNIKYTQSKPPRGIDYQTIYQRQSGDNDKSKPKPEERLDASNDSATKAQDDIIAKQRQEKQRAEKANKEIARKNCTIAKNNIEVLQNRSRVQIEEKGTRRMLTDKERSDKLKKAQENVTKFCK